MPENSRMMSDSPPSYVKHKLSLDYVISFLLSRQISVVKLQQPLPSSLLSDGKILLFCSTTLTISPHLAEDATQALRGRKLIPFPGVFLSLSTVTEQMHPLSFPIFLSLEGIKLTGREPFFCPSLLSPFRVMGEPFCRATTAIIHLVYKELRLGI